MSGQQARSQPHRRWSYRLPVALEEELVAALWEAGTRGVQVLPADEGHVRLEAWFGPESADEPLAPGWQGRGVEFEGAEQVDDADWLEPWRKVAQPLEVGRFVLDPREPEEVAEVAAGGRVAADQVRLALPARNAFGTGSHESTRLALELLEATPFENARVLDVGTGTGVLAFAALVLGAASVTGFDIDPASAVQARANRALNEAVLPAGAAFRPYAGEVAALSAAARFDRILVNVLPGRILGSLPALVDRLAPGGCLLFSGIVTEQAATVLEHAGLLGLVPDLGVAEDEWVAYRFRRGDDRAGARG